MLLIHMMVIPLSRACPQKISEANMSRLSQIIGQSFHLGHTANIHIHTHLHRHTHTVTHIAHYTTLTLHSGKPGG